jgi:hypothetical protein
MKEKIAKPKLNTHLKDDLERNFEPEIDNEPDNRESEAEEDYYISLGGDDHSYLDEDIEE